LHPSAPIPESIENTPLPYQFDPPDVIKSLKSLSRGTASGPSRFFPEHLLNAVECPTPDKAYRAATTLTDVVNVLAAGKRAPEVLPWMFGTNLYALKKKKGVVSPIAVSEVLLKLRSRKLFRSLSPLEFDVATRGGVEAVVHATKTTFDCALINCHGILMVDFRNAFNTLDRVKMITEVHRRLPGLAAFTEFCYTVKCKVLFGEYILDSECGVQQGDPLGPLLFCCSSVPSGLIDGDIPGLSHNSWYFDDGLCAGDQASLVRALEIITVEGKNWV